ncbi:alpha-L-rhamnosidase-related protein [Membranihabitans maritimus]|uniref:alpha-L-rhamnosidase-related protein n=1 Tax=Membranihabitans maritimus TaxID=2904244 RepID=UPI001F2A62F8|nr:alpha-L-rhamnosidase [Membranihabitans maritimus]
MRNLLGIFICTFLNLGILFTQNLDIPGYEPILEEAQESEISSFYVSPQRILWKSDKSGQWIKNSDALLKKGKGQADLTNQDLCSIKNPDGDKSSILIDFGVEIHGGIQIITGMMAENKPIKVRVRFGESAEEAMSDLGPESSATNDHAMRDVVLELPWLGKREIGDTGFRFVRIDLEDENRELLLKEVRAELKIRDIPYVGSFTSSDERLNKIWNTGAYTVHLNMQDYLWDGIKRDRLVWVGDMHPEVSTINAVFGYNPVVPKSLDLMKELTPLPGWMNGISTYSMWWLIIHRDWYNQYGNLEYLNEQREYVSNLLELFMQKIDDEGKEQLDGHRFLDWPTSEQPQSIHAGYQALLIMTLEAGVEICTALEENELKAQCEQAIKDLRGYTPDHNDSKQAASLMVLAGLMEPRIGNRDVISVGGPRDFSTFYGYYMLEAMAEAGNYTEAMDIIKEYWGGMLDLGATTFWEDFNIEWLEDGARIDELVPENKTDTHGDNGNYCYVGYRHSFCHGWASGPTAWMSRYVLGVKVVEPGGKVLKIEPHLGDLEWVEGSYPTPLGPVKIRHSKMADGGLKTEIEAPEGIEVMAE